LRNYQKEKEQRAIDVNVKDLMNSKTQLKVPNFHFPDSLRRFVKIATVIDVPSHAIKSAQFSFS